MPRNFDEIRAQKDLDFVLAGQTFKIRMLPLMYIGIWTEREDKVDLGDQAAFQQMCIDRVADAVDDGNGAAQRWRDLCESDKGPSYGELLELARWVWEAQSDLPTMPPAPSAGGRGATAASSKAG